MKLLPFINQILLREGKREDYEIIKKYNIDQYYYDMIRNMDPSPTKKYTKYILLMLGKGKMKEFEISDPQSVILNSKKLRQFFEMGAKIDFSSFKTWDEFKAYMEPHVDWVGKRELKLVASDPSAMSIVQDNEFCYIVKLKKKEAACVYGTGTHWCVSQKDKDFFKQYNSSSILYEIISRIYKKHADNPLLFKLMLLVPRSSGYAIQLVAADNVHHNVSIQNNKCILTSGAHREVLQNYINKLNINWDDIMFENLKNFDPSSVISADGILNISGDFIAYMNYKKYEDLLFLNIPNLIVSAYSLRHLKNITSLKGIAELTIESGIDFTNISNEQLNEYIPTFRVIDPYISIKINNNITDFSFLAKIKSNIQIRDIAISTEGITDIKYLPPPETLSSLYKSVSITRASISNDIDISKYENLVFGTLYNFNEDKTELTLQYNESPTLYVSRLREFETLKIVNISMRDVPERFRIDCSDTNERIFEFNFNNDMRSITFDYIIPKSINKDSKKSIREIRINADGTHSKTSLSLHGKIESCRLYYCKQTTITSDFPIKYCLVQNSTPDLSGIKEISQLELDGTCPSIEFPQYTNELNFTYTDELPTFNLKDFMIDKIKYDGYDNQYLYKFLLNFNFIPNEIKPKLSDDQMLHLKANIKPKEKPPTLKKKISKSTYKAYNYDDIGGGIVGPDLAKKLNRKVKKPMDHNDAV